MADTKPSITIPAGDAPAERVLEDLELGEGTEAVAGTNVTVHYVGVAWSNGQQFDASWDRNDTFSFRLGAGQVISGWDQGVAGMRVGGRRSITIPPHSGAVTITLSQPLGTSPAGHAVSLSPGASATVQ